MTICKNCGLELFRYNNKLYCPNCGDENGEKPPVKKGKTKGRNM